MVCVDVANLSLSLFLSLSLKAFNSTTSFGRLESIDATVAGRNVYLRFACMSGDAMGMNMVSACVLRMCACVFACVCVCTVSVLYCVCVAIHTQYQCVFCCMCVVLYFVLYCVLYCVHGLEDESEFCMHSRPP